MELRMCAQERPFSLDVTSPPMWSCEAFDPVSLSRCCGLCVFPYFNITVRLDRSLYCTPITIICSHVGLWGHDGIRQHRGAHRAGRGESQPDDLWSFWQKRCVCQHAPAGSAPGRPAGLSEGGERGRQAQTTAYSILFYSVTSYTIQML